MEEVLEDDRHRAAQLVGVDGGRVDPVPEHAALVRYSRHSSLARVVLPEPFSPTRATISPAPISSDTPVTAGVVALG